MSNGKYKTSQTAGALTMALCGRVAYLFIAQILEAVDFPISLPVGDLSTVILGKTQRARIAEVGQLESGLANGKLAKKEE